MIILFSLYVLACLDCMFSGYRSAAGRNALIYKKKYFLHYMLVGLLLGQIPILIAFGSVCLIFVLTNNEVIFLQNVMLAGYWMLVIYAPYALIILVAFVIRIIPSVDSRSITSIAIFGPFTIIRPFVAAIGMLLAIVKTMDILIFPVLLITLIMMLSFEQFLNRFCKFEPK